jgi:hypothetical protein
VESTPHPVVDGPPAANGLPDERPRWTQRRVAHSWIVVVLTSVLLAAAAVCLVLVVRNVALTAFLGAATTAIEQQ